MVGADDAASLPASFWAAVRNGEVVQDPFPYFRSLGDVPACSHATAAFALKDHRFSVAPPIDSDRPLWRMHNRWLISRNAPEHTAIRRRLTRAFTKTAVEGYRPLVTSAIETLLDELEPLGEMDLYRQFAFPVPTAVICELMQLPDSARAGLEELLVDLGLAFLYADREECLDRGDRAVEELTARMHAVLSERLADPGDDLVSRLVTVDGEDGDAPVGHDDLVANAVLLLHAGHETTMNTLTTGIYTLLKHPEQLDRLRADLTLVPSAVEEVLRYNSAIGIAPRVAREDVALPQGMVREGSTIPFLLGALNRDPAVFANPDVFDVARADNPHLAFGAGAHRCLGAPLARLEIELAVAAIVQRLLGLRLAEEPRWTGVIPFRGLDSLHVVWCRSG